MSFVTESPPPVTEMPLAAVIPFTNVVVEFTVSLSVEASPMKKSSRTPARLRVEEALAVKTEVEAEFVMARLVEVASRRVSPPALVRERRVVLAEFATLNASSPEAVESPQTERFA